MPLFVRFIEVDPSFCKKDDRMLTAAHPMPPRADQHLRDIASRTGHRARAEGRASTSKAMTSSENTCTTSPRDPDGSPSIPDLYRSALRHKWTEVMNRCGSHPTEASYVHPNDGSTALHLAVISRVTQADTAPVTASDSLSCASLSRTSGTSSTSSRRKSVRDIWGNSTCPAPLAVIRALLEACPEAAEIRCKPNSYTPLTYACLVPPVDVEIDCDEDEDGNLNPHSRLDKNAADQMPRPPSGMVDHTRRNEFPRPPSMMITSPSNQTPEPAPTPPTKRRSPPAAKTPTLQDSEDLVCLILKYSKSCASILTASGLTPLDVHIVSYSQTRAPHDYDDIQPKGQITNRITTGVLRALLETDATLAQSRPDTTRQGGGMTIGPLELLYRCNSPAFLAAMAAEDTRRREESANDSDHGKRPWYGDFHRHPLHAKSYHKFLSSHATLSNWWGWKWTVLLLKYGTLHQKRRGARFMALHAAASVKGCPLPILLLSVRAFPKQIRELDVSDVEGVGNLPLHIVCSWELTPIGQPEGKEDSSVELPLEEEQRQAIEQYTDSMAINVRKDMAITALLNEHPGAAKIKNQRGELPLSVALRTGTTWEGGVRKLVKAFPESVSIKDDDRMGGLYPFMLAATVAPPSPPEEEEDGSDEAKKKGSLKVSFAEDGKQRGYAARGSMAQLVNILSQPGGQKGARSPSASSIPPPSEKEVLMHVATIYGLLRADPGIVSQCCLQDSYYDDNWALRSMRSMRSLSTRAWVAQFV